MLKNTVTSDADTPSNEVLASIAKALAHPARVQIIRLLLSRNSCIGGEITDELGLAQSTVSEHLRILKTSGLVVGEIEHPRVCYSLSLQNLQPLVQFLAAIDLRYQNTGLVDGLCCPLQDTDEPSVKNVSSKCISTKEL